MESQQDFMFTQEQFNLLLQKLPFTDNNVDFIKCESFMTKNDKSNSLGLSLQDILDGLYEYEEATDALCANLELIQSAFDKAKSYSSYEQSRVSETQLKFFFQYIYCYIYYQIMFKDFFPHFDNTLTQNEFLQIAHEIEFEEDSDYEIIYAEMDWKKKGVIDMYDFTEVVVHIKNMEILEKLNALEELRQSQAQWFNKNANTRGPKLPQKQKVDLVQIEQNMQKTNSSKVNQSNIFKPNMMKRKNQKLGKANDAIEETEIENKGISKEDIDLLANEYNQKQIIKEDLISQLEEIKEQLEYFRLDPYASKIKNQSNEYDSDDLSQQDSEDFQENSQQINQKNQNEILQEDHDEN